MSFHQDQEPEGLIGVQQPDVATEETSVIVLHLSQDGVGITRPGLPQMAVLSDSSEPVHERDCQVIPVKDLWAIIQECSPAVRIKTIDLLAPFQDPAFLPVFLVALFDEHWEVRAATAQALGPLKLGHLSPLLCDVLQKETDCIVQQALVRALGHSQSESTIPLLTRLLQDQEQDPLVREAAAWALGEFRQKAPFLVLQEALQADPDELVQGTIAEVLEALQAGHVQAP